MPVRNATLADEGAIRDLWNDNAPLNRPIYQALGINWPTWTVQDARSKVVDLVQQGIARCGVWTPTIGGPVQAFGLSLRRRRERNQVIEDMRILLVLLVRRANGTVNAQASQERMVIAVTELLEAWGRACRNDNVDFCEGWYPTSGHQSMIDFLNAMSTRNGIPADLTSRPGWMGYTVTPDDIIIGVGGIP